MATILALDLGSRRSKLVRIEDGRVAGREILPPLALAWAAIAERVASAGSEAVVVATGYGRHQARERLGASIHTEIRCFGRGAACVAPETRTLIDLGGQDAKVMRLDGAGGVADFEMNDRCAAGTGKFFEMVARTLDLDYARLLEVAAAATEVAPVSATCAVFAESEIVGLMAAGATPGAIARGCFRSVALRLETMVRRVGVAPPVGMAGGGANPVIAGELAERLGASVALLPDAVFVGAIGAASLAAGRLIPSSSADGPVAPRETDVSRRHSGGNGTLLPIVGDG